MVKLQVQEYLLESGEDIDHNGIQLTEPAVWEAA